MLPERPAFWHHVPYSSNPQSANKFPCQSKFAHVRRGPHHDANIFVNFPAEDGQVEPRRIGVALKTMATARINKKMENKLIVSCAIKVCQN